MRWQGPYESICIPTVLSFLWDWFRSLNPPDGTKSELMMRNRFLALSEHLIKILNYRTSAKLSINNEKFKSSIPQLWQYKYGRKLGLGEFKKRKSISFKEPKHRASISKAFSHHFQIEKDSFIRSGSWDEMFYLRFRLQFKIYLISGTGSLAEQSLSWMNFL